MTSFELVPPMSDMYEVYPYIEQKNPHTIIFLLVVYVAYLVIVMKVYWLTGRFSQGRSLTTNSKINPTPRPIIWNILNPKLNPILSLKSFTRPTLSHTLIMTHCRKHLAPFQIISGDLNYVYMTFLDHHLSILQHHPLLYQSVDCCTVHPFEFWPFLFKRC